jgi:hypothetical protein
MQDQLSHFSGDQLDDQALRADIHFAVRDPKTARLWSHALHGVINMPRPKAQWINDNLLRESPMQKPPLDPDVADTAPSDSVLTVYDEEHVITYLRLLDADAAGADWREVARVVLRLDPEHESDRARRAFESHLSRAKWMTEHGFRHLLRGGALA